MTPPWVPVAMQVLFVEVLVHDFCLTVAEKEALAANAKEEAQNKELVKELQQVPHVLSSDLTTCLATDFLSSKRMFVA